MRVLRGFLRPGWILLGLVVIAFAAACFMILAPWQLGKNADTQHRNDLIQAAAATDPVALDELVPSGAGMPAGAEWHSVTMRGTFVADQQVVLRLRSVDERPAVDVLVPFALADPVHDPAGGRTVLVDRGWLRPASDGSVEIKPLPAGEVEVTGRLRAPEQTSPGKEARTENGQLSAYTIDPAEITRVTSIPLEPFYVELADGSPGALDTHPLPQLESGPYLSYGLQWLAFGIMAPLAVGYFVYAEVRNRRAERAKQAGPDDVPATPEPARPASDRDRVRRELHGAGTFAGNDVDLAGADIGGGATPDEDAPDAVKVKLAQRYGK